MQRKTLLAKIQEHRKNKFDWRSLAFPRQIECIEDKSRLKIYFTTRRGAKSYTDGIELISDGLESDGCNCLYLGLTRLSAKAIIWKDVLKDIDTKKNLGIKFHETELTATLSNGSVIYVAGVDIDENERKKLFGRKYKRIVIDEAALYTIDLKDLVYVALRPATADLKGSITLSGMSSNIITGLFFDLTKNAPKNGPNGEPSGKWKEKGWSCHAWTAHDNPFVPWEEELDFIRKNEPELIDTPTFQQAYLNWWVVDEDAKVYKYNKDINTAAQLPAMNDWHYILGVDLGHSPDPSAFVVGAYHDTLDVLYIVHDEAHLRMDVTDVADKVKELDYKYKFEVKIVDNANKQAVEELNNRHKVNLIAAEKYDKASFINICNSDFIKGKIKLLAAAKELGKELETLIWVTDSGKIKEPRKEHPSLPNHRTDAFLYMWRHGYQYLWAKPKDIVPWDSQARWENQHIEQLQEQVRKEQNPSHLELDMDKSIWDFDQDDAI